MRRSLTVVLFVLLLTTACREAAPAPEPTPSPTLSVPTATVVAATPTADAATPVAPTPTLAGSVVPAPTATVTPLPEVTATPAASATVTSVPPPTSTRPPTATPVPSSTPAPGLAINHFTADRQIADPGDPLQLSWSTQGATAVTLWLLLPTGQFGEFWDVPPAGSFTYDIPDGWRNAINFLLYAENAAGTRAQSSVNVTLRCTAEWFFSNPPDVCPQDAPLASPAAQQRFQNGTMLWVGAEDRIYVLFDDQQYPRMAVYQDEWDPGEPESDPTLAPPPGLYQPIRGFGLVWRQHARDRLGWAVEPEAGFDTLIQRTSYWKYNHTYIGARDGAIWHLLPERSGWELLAP